MHAPSKPDFVDDRQPARSLAPDLLRGDPSTRWIHGLGPEIGDVVVVVISFERILKGGATRAGTVAAQGEADD